MTFWFDSHSSRASKYSHGHTSFDAWNAMGTRLPVGLYWGRCGDCHQFCLYPERPRISKLARRKGAPFDVVIMDLTIANGLGGQETIRRLRELDPCVKAIVSSGYSNDPVMANFRDFGFVGVVPKPYNTEDLAAALDELLCPAP